MKTLDALARLVTERLGLRPSERSWVGELAARVEVRRAALGLPSDDAYVRRVMLAPDAELAHLAPAFTNGWTWFFRDHDAIEALVLELARMRLGRTAHVWVAGCSSGEEAYGVAIACAAAELDARVLASDVDAERLAVAARARYDAAALRRVPEATLRRFFDPSESGLQHVTGSIRERVDLRLHNLLDPAPAAPSAGGWDAIICRNVLLHCTDEACAAISTNLERALAPHGVLLLGPGDPQPSGGRARASWIPRPPSSRPAPAAPSASARSAIPAPAALPRSARPISRPPPAPGPEPHRAREPLRADDWARAVAAIREGAHEHARDVLESWLITRPAHVDARLALGNLWLAAHELERAADAYERAGAIEPDCAELHFLWGALHRKRGAWGTAATALRRALFHDPELWPARFLLAGAWERLGEGERARMAWTETLRSLARRPRIQWRSHVDEIEGLACPAERVRALGEQRVRRESGSTGG